MVAVESFAPQAHRNFDSPRLARVRCSGVAIVGDGWMRSIVTLMSVRKSFSWFWKHLAAACFSFVALIILVLACDMRGRWRVQRRVQPPAPDHPSECRCGPCGVRRTAPKSESLGRACSSVLFSAYGATTGATYTTRVLKMAFPTAVRLDYFWKGRLGNPNSNRVPAGTRSIRGAATYTYY